MPQNNKTLFQRIFIDIWPYWVGGLMLGLVNILLFIYQGSPWAVTHGVSYWGSWIIEKLGIDVGAWEYFHVPKHAKALAAGVFKNNDSIINIGTIFGALLAALVASNFKVRKIKSLKQFSAALFGGIIMGYGTRISFGCNIGALFSGTASFSLHGWVYMVFIFVGAYIGSKFLVKYLL